MPLGETSSLIQEDDQLVTIEHLKNSQEKVSSQNEQAAIKMKHQDVSVSKPESSKRLTRYALNQDPNKSEHEHVQLSGKTSTVVPSKSTTSIPETDKESAKKD